MCQLSLDHIFPQDLRRPYDSRRWAMRWVITRPSAVVAEVCNGRWPCNFFRRWRSWRWRLVCVVMGSHRFIDATHRWQPWCYCRCRKRGKPQICLELCWVKLLSGLENVWRGRTEFDSLYRWWFHQKCDPQVPTGWEQHPCSTAILGESCRIVPRVYFFPRWHHCWPSRFEKVNEVYNDEKKMEDAIRCN